MLRTVAQRSLRAAAAAANRHLPLFIIPNSVINEKGNGSHNQNLSPSYSLCSRPFSSGAKPSGAKGAKGAKAANPKGKAAKGGSPMNSEQASSVDDIDFDLPLDDQGRADEEDDESLNIGPKGFPLFTQAKSISELTRKDVCSYMDFSMEELNAVLAEGLPLGMKKEFEETKRSALLVRQAFLELRDNFSMEELNAVLAEGLPLGMKKEFEETKRSALLVRQAFLELRDNFRRVVDPTIHHHTPKVKKQIVLDGPVSCGKSIALAMLVHWARTEGWIVFYVPYGRQWTHGGFFYKNPQTGLWDTPIQATKILQDFLKCNEAQMQKLPCKNFEPIPLGEGAGIGMMKGVDSMAMPEGSTLYDLIQTGLTYSQAAVGVVVRLREELSLIKDIPVIFAIDQYNNWFTFSEYQEPVTARSCRPIHAKELSTVHAFRSMLHDDMMVGAFSHSTAVGKLRKNLPDVPLDARLFFPRYSLDEAATVCSYYRRQRLIRPDGFSEENWKKIYYLANGNGAEMRWLVPLM